MLLDDYIEYLNRIKATEISKKVKQFESYLNNNLKSNVVYDELIDFIDLKTNRKTRWESFARYIETRYNCEEYKNILDVGSGVNPLLSLELKKKGYNVTAIDPRIELNNEIKCVKALFDYEKIMC